MDYQVRPSLTCCLIILFSSFLLPNNSERICASLQADTTMSTIYYIILAVVAVFILNVSYASDPIASYS